MVVALIGLTEAFSALADLVLIGDIARTPDFSPDRLVTLAPMVLHLLLGLAALGFAVTGRLRFGVAALALWALARWASDVPSLIRGGLGISSGTDLTVIGLALFRTFGQPFHEMHGKVTQGNVEWRVSGLLFPLIAELGPSRREGGAYREHRFKHALSGDHGTCNTR